MIGLRMTSPLPVILTMLGLAVLSAAPAAAQFGGPTLANPSPPVAERKAPAAKPVRTCPEYGAGYMRLDSGICVKIGGYLRAQGGIYRR